MVLDKNDPGRAAELWIVVPNWHRFQHYRDRSPPWVKTYTELLHDENYLELTMHQRGVLHGLWLAYAATHGQLRGSTATVTRQLGGRVSRATLQRLNQAGFIQFSASKPLALARSPEERREREELFTNTTSWEDRRTVVEEPSKLAFEEQPWSSKTSR
jgi:hypothetical protein